MTTEIYSNGRWIKDSGDFDTVEYDTIAKWCSEHGLTSVPNDCRTLVSPRTMAEIDEYPEEFELRIRRFSYALACEKGEF